MNVLSDLQIDCLRDAVYIAKSEQITLTANLRLALKVKGYASGTISEALRFWERYEHFNKYRPK